MKKTFKFFLILTIIFIFGVIFIGGQKTNKNNPTKQEEIVKQEKLVSRINKWFKEEYVKNYPMYYEEEINPYYLQLAVINGFKYSSENILLVVDNNRMKAEGFSAQQLADRGNVALLEYAEKENIKFKNFDNKNYPKEKLEYYDLFYE